MSTNQQMTSLSSLSLRGLLALSVAIGAGACVTDGDELATRTQALSTAATVIPMSGTGQDREVMSSFDVLVVTVHDTYGNPMVGASVQFTAPASGASATFRFDGITETDDTGRAEVRPYANSISGIYVVKAYVDGADPVPFVLRNQAAAPAVMIPVIGTNQARPLGELFPQPLTVAVYDSYGNAVENAPVSFEAPTSGATTRMTAPSTITNEDGHASVFATAGHIAGTYTVNARVTGAPTIPFVLRNTTIEPFPELSRNNSSADSTGTLTAAP